MHPSAMANGKLFFDTYVTRLGDVTVVDIGAQDVNGSLREVCPPDARYIGVDFADAKGVDIVLTDPYVLPFDDESVDVVVSSSCFEHAEMFWIVFLEVLRVLKPSGLFYLNAPSNGLFHRFPVDCWRFYPDSGRALATWAQRCGVSAALIESYTSPQHTDPWNDFVAVFAKDESRIGQHPNRMLSALSAFENGFVYGSGDILRMSTEPQDLRLLEDSRGKLNTEVERATNLANDLAMALQRVEALTQELSRSKSAIDDSTCQLEVLKKKIKDMESSTSWKVTAPLRALIRSIN